MNIIFEQQEGRKERTRDDDDDDDDYDNDETGIFEFHFAHFELL